MKVEFETAREAAQRMGVTVRAVQKWAASGKIPGATRMGKAWMIPKLVSLIEEPGEHTGHMIDHISFRRPLPLTNGSFPPGEARAYAESLPDPDDRRIALGEYYYFTGNAEQAVEIAEEYMDSEDPSLAYSARMICLYANLTMGHIRRAQFAAKAMYADLEAGIQSDSPPILHAIGIFTANVIATQIQLEIPQLPPLETYIRYLPGGMKQFSMYIMALQAYREKNYLLMSFVWSLCCRKWWRREP